MDPTTIIVTAAITALVTTVVAEFVKIGIRSLGRRWGKRHVPAVLARRNGWVLANQSRAVLLDVNVSIAHTAPGSTQSVTSNLFLGSITPRGRGVINAPIEDGDWVTVNWTIWSRVRRRQRYFIPQVQIRSTENDYPLIKEDIIGPGGM